jgi:alpha-beta hydrolase superfamily lysophospholipase
MTKHLGTVTNLELRESNTDGTEGAGLSHTAEGLHLLHVYEVAGDGEPRGGVTIVHDLGEHGGRYVELADRLADDGWALALPDLRGHGHSEGPRGHSWGVPEPVRDVQSVQEHVAYRLPDHPKVLIGIGVGALYVLAFAQQHRGGAQALVLISPVLDPVLTAPPSPGGLKGLFKKPKPLDEGPLGWPAERRFASATARAAFNGDALCHDLTTRHTAERLPGEAAAVRAGLASLEVPTLVIHGELDDLASPASSEQIRADERIVVPGAGHGVLHEECGGEWIEHIARFVDTRCPR